MIPVSKKLQARLNLWGNTHISTDVFLHVCAKVWSHIDDINYRLIDGVKEKIK